MCVCVCGEVKGRGGRGGQKKKATSRGSPGGSAHSALFSSAFSTRLVWCGGVSAGCSFASEMGTFDTFLSFCHGPKMTKQGGDVSRAYIEECRGRRRMNREYIYAVRTTGRHRKTRKKKNSNKEHGLIHVCVYRMCVTVGRGNERIRSHCVSQVHSALEAYKITFSLPV